MKFDINKYESFALLGATGPLIILAFVVFVIVIAPFALLGYFISKIFNFNSEEIYK